MYNINVCLINLNLIIMKKTIYLLFAKLFFFACNFKEHHLSIAESENIFKIYETFSTL